MGGKCTLEQFKRWVDKTYDKFLNDKRFDNPIFAHNRTIVYSLYDCRVGMAMLHSDGTDKYDLKIGVALAYARALGRNVASCDETFDFGNEYKEVK